MKITTLIILGAVLTVSSCDKDQKPTYLKDSTAATNSTGTVDAAKAKASNMLLPAAQNASSPALPGAVAPGQPVAGTQKTAAGTNPPHGQPGHKCEIPVGAPLNSAPKSPASAPQSITVDPNSAKKDPAAYNVTPPPSTAPGMNPPHGQPGHRCDISVGAPLNSPAKSTSANTAPASIVPANAKPDPMAYNVANKPAPAASAKSGLNPAHGQPGHRCDIAVGAPLK